MNALTDSCLSVRILLGLTEHFAVRTFGGTPYAGQIVCRAEDGDRKTIIALGNQLYLFIQETLFVSDRSATSSFGLGKQVANGTKCCRVSSSV